MKSNDVQTQVKNNLKTVMMILKRASFANVTTEELFAIQAELAQFEQYVKAIDGNELLVTPVEQEGPGDDV